MILIGPYYIEQSGSRHWLIKRKGICNSEIVAIETTKRKAQAICRKLNAALQPTS